MSSRVEKFRASPFLEILRQAFELLSRHKRALAVFVLIPWSWFVFSGFAFWINQPFQASIAFRFSAGVLQYTQWAVSVLSWVFFIVSVMAALIYVSSRDQGHALSVGKSYQTAARKFPVWVLFLAAMSLAAIFFLICLIIPGLIFLSRHAHAGVIFVTENRTARQAMEWSRHITAGRGFKGLDYEAGIVLIVIALVLPFAVLENALLFWMRFPSIWIESLLLYTKIMIFLIGGIFSAALHYSFYRVFAKAAA